MFANLIPMIVQDLRPGWSEEVVATDASGCGLGAMVSRFDSDVMGRYRRLSERWRFRLGAGHGGAPAQAGIETVDGILGAELAEPRDASEAAGGPARAGRRGTWEEVPADILKGPWRLVGRSKWQRMEHMNVLEGRAFLLVSTDCVAEVPT